MFCSRCGCEVKEGAAFCTNCGAPQRKAAADNSSNGRGADGRPIHRTQYNVLSIVGMALSCIALIIFNCYGLVGLAGLIVSRTVRRMTKMEEHLPLLALLWVVLLFWLELSLWLFFMGFLTVAFLMQFTR